MAKYQVEMSCGHTETKQLYGKYADRERKMEWMGREMLCTDCYKAEQQAKREAGSDDASRVKAEVMKDFEAVKAQFDAAPDNAPNIDIAREVLAAIADNNDAGWWIDHRDYTLVALIKSETKKRLAE